MSAPTLSPNEFCILKLLWSANHALTRPEILEALPEQDWNPNSIHLILNNMIKKVSLRSKVWPAAARLWPYVCPHHLQDRICRSTNHGYHLRYVRW